METIRFGIIGLGNIGPTHAVAIANTDGAKLVAVADTDHLRAEAVATKYGARRFSDYRDLLDCKDVDAVCICTPPSLHAAMSIDAAAAGKHVLCEKPMARTIDECDAMIAAWERAKVTFGVVFPIRFDPLSAKLKAAIDEGMLGHLLWTSANTLWYRDDAYFQSASWRGTWEHEGGGVLINQAIHAVDFLLWTAGTPTRVTAHTRTLNHSIEAEDAAVVALEYPDNRLGLIQATTIAKPGFPMYFEYFGSNGSVVYNVGLARLEWHIASPARDWVEQGEASNGAAARPMDISAGPHTAIMRDFVAAIRAGRQPFVNGHEGRRSIELVQAIYRSARTGNTIRLPLAPD